MQAVLGHDSLQNEWAHSLVQNIVKRSFYQLIQWSTAAYAVSRDSQKYVTVQLETAGKAGRIGTS